MRHLQTSLLTLLIGALSLTVPARSQPGGGPPPSPGGPGGAGGHGFRGPMGQPRELLGRFDADGDGVLNLAERTAARAAIKEEDDGRRQGPRPGFGRGNEEPATPGPRVDKADVPAHPGVGLYDPTVLRTIFLDFESGDWEAELADFYNSDVEVPATLTVDGVEYPGVGVHFRGASSYFTVAPGHKRSFNVSVDARPHKGRRVLGARTLNLLNANGDPSMMSSALYSWIARPHIPVPRANFVKVVVNGESWGVYVNVEQFNGAFVAAHFGSADGARWKVKGSPNGDAGLFDLGDNLEPYRARYEIKSADRESDWRALVELCRTLTHTPLDELEAALRPVFDVDGALWFLALDTVLVNSDGYWARASDYSLCRDGDGVFHLIPHDMNEAFAGGGMGGPRAGGPGFPAGAGPGGPGPRDADEPPPRERPAAPRADGGAGPDRPEQPGGGRRGGRGPRQGGVELDPLVGLDDERKPLRSRLLAVPALREKYLEHVRTLADGPLDWRNMGPVVAQWRALIEDDVRADTRKLASYEAFQRATADEPAAGDAAAGRGLPLRAFADRRRAYLMAHPAMPRELGEHAQPGPHTADVVRPRGP